MAYDEPRTVAVGDAVPIATAAEANAPREPGPVAEFRARHHLTTPQFFADALVGRVNAPEDIAERDKLVQCAAWHEGWMAALKAFREATLEMQNPGATLT